MLEFYPLCDLVALYSLICEAYSWSALDNLFQIVINSEALIQFDKVRIIESQSMLLGDKREEFVEKMIEELQAHL